jgi:hypothetical protein
MKKILVVILVTVFVMLLQSCGAYYDYIQIISTKPINNIEKTSLTNGGVLYEDENCAVFYKFWTEGGDAGFEFYNKTNEIIYLDLTKTFFIKNGIAYDYYEDKTVTDTETSHTSSTVTHGYALSASSSYSASISQYYAGNFGQKPTTTYSPLASSASVGASNSMFGSLFKMSSTSTVFGHSTSVAITDKPILAIPPRSSKYVKNYSIVGTEFISCDLEYYPVYSAKLTFDIANSPVTFSNYITFTKGDKSQVYSVENKFYVNDITNYVKQNVTRYVKREETCENILTPDELAMQKTMPTIYDAYITAGDASSFYIPYTVYSKKTLYKKKNNMIWNHYYNGYTSTSGSWYTEDIVSNTVPSQGSKQSSGQSSKPEAKETTQNHIQKFYRLGWQNSELCLTYLIALEQIELIEDKDLANKYTASINTLIDKVFTNQISKDSLEKKIKNAKNSSDKVEYRILLDIAKNIK